LQAKYGHNPDEWEESYDSENGSEDSEAKMMTSKMDEKFNELMKRIQMKDKAFLDG